jgi:hypothetical protein
MLEAILWPHGFIIRKSSSKFKGGRAPVIFDVFELELLISRITVSILLERKYADPLTFRSWRGSICR